MPHRAELKTTRALLLLCRLLFLPSQALRRTYLRPSFRGHRSAPALFDRRVLRPVTRGGFGILNFSWPSTSSNDRTIQFGAQLRKVRQDGSAFLIQFPQPLLGTYQRPSL
jgi:hypothetical protein